jgi:hypothetical protein
VHRSYRRAFQKKSSDPAFIMFTAIALCFVLVIVSVNVVESAKDTNPVTCGSVIKLQHKETVRHFLDRIAS